MAGAVVSALAGFALVILITNSFDSTTAGVVFSASSLFIVALSLTTLGADVGLGRFVLRYVAEGRPDAVRVVIRTAFWAVLTTSVAVAVTLAVLSPAISRWMGLDQHQGRLVVVVFALCLPLSTAGSLSLATSRAFGAIRPTVLVDKLGRSVGQPLCVLVVVLAGAGVLKLTVAWVLPYVLAAIVSCVLVHRMLERRAPMLEGQPHDAPVLRKEFWSFNWPRAIASVSQIAIQRADIIIIGVMISPSAAAVYTAATRFVVLGQFGLQAIQQVLQPQITHLLATDQMGVLSRVFKIATAWNVAIAWPIYLAVGCAPGVYLSVFGDTFSEQGRLTVIVMMLGMLAGVYSGPVDTLLLMAGRSTVSLVNSLVALTIDLGGCLLLIPVMGISGAAVAWAAAVVVRSFLGYLQVRRALGLSPISKASAVSGSAAVGCFGLPMLLLNLTGHETLPAFIAVGLVGTVVYLVMLRLAKRTLHLRALRGLFSRGNDAPIGEVA
jgi:O-antigen/teichoic acid export membrane protein